jgi:hypothetical protein
VQKLIPLVPVQKLIPLVPAQKLIPLVPAQKLIPLVLAQAGTQSLLPPPVLDSRVRGNERRKV